MEEAAAATSSSSYFRTRNSTRNGLNLAVVPSPLPVMMAGVIPYPYRPDPDFYYLTGITQPGCVAVVVAEEEGGGENEESGEESEESGLGRRRRRRAAATTAKKRRRQHRFILFVPDECPRTRLWDGGRLSVEAAKRVFGADEAFPMSQVRRRETFVLKSFGKRKKKNLKLDQLQLFFKKQQQLHSRLSPLLSAASLVLSDADRSAGADPRYSALAEERLMRKTGGERAAAGSFASAAPASSSSSKVQPLRPHTHTLRWVKSDAELALMRRSAEMAAAGMRAAMAASNLSCGGGGSGDASSVSERELAAAFEHEVKRRGADRLAYPPVVAGGSRACTIHYSRNDQRLKSGTWLLMDAGCEFWGYASDVSRAWPVVSGSSHSSSSSSSASALFSSGPHSDVYHALLEVHSQCVRAAVPGTSLSEMHALSVSLLAEAAARLGGAGVKDPRSAVPALRGLSAADIAGRGGRQGPLTGGAGGSGGIGIYPHAVGHWLGLDTHDAPLGVNTGSGAALVPNVVLTIEPGLYFPADESRWGRLAGVGMRLEDDVAVRGRRSSGREEEEDRGGRGQASSSSSPPPSSGPEVLSAGAPLLPAEVAAAIDGS